MTPQQGWLEAEIAYLELALDAIGRAEVCHRRSGASAETRLTAEAKVFAADRLYRARVERETLRKLASERRSVR